METTTTVYQIHPLWILIFILGYFLGGYVFYKTVSIEKTLLFFILFQITTVAVIYLYYDIPF